MANDWTDEQENDFKRAKADYDALNAQRSRVQVANRDRLETICADVLRDRDLADDLIDNANAFRVALEPYDRGPKPVPMPADEVAREHGA